MKTHEKLLGRLCVALLTGAAVAGLVGCPNLSRDLDLKARIETDVAEANARQISIQVVPESSAMGVTSPAGTTSAKIGVAFQVSASASAEYAFVRWEKTAGDGDVAFADPTSLETMATITGNGTGIVITARYNARPVAVIKEPEGTNVLINAPIAITFSEDVDDSTIILGETVIVTVSPDRVTWSAPTGVTLAKSVSGSLVTISLTAGTYGINYYVRVDVLKSVTDLDGHMMPEGIFWRFKTGGSSDEEDPNLESLAVKEGTTVIPDGEATRFSTGLTIVTTATDNLDVTTMRVKETDLTTLATAEITRGYSPSLAYTLQTPGDGTKLIEVVVLDGVNNESNVRSQTIVLDMVPPTVTSTSINGGAATVTSTSVTLALGASDDRSGLSQYQLSETSGFSDGTTTAWTAWTPTPGYTLSTGDGMKTVYARVKDAAGNVSTEAVLNSDSIMLDAMGPTFSSVTINGGVATTVSTGVTLSINATDAGSSVAGYQVSEDSSFTGMTTWESWTSTPQTASFTLSGGDGLKTVYVRVRDVNGNINGATTLDRDSIMLDAVGPTFSSVTINGGATSTTGTGVTLSINATDAGSSVAGYQVSEDSSFTGMTTWESWTSTPQTASFTLSGGDGVKTVYVRVRDANGHINGATTLDRDTISLDQLAPVFSSQVVINSGATATNNPAVTLSINATDAGSSVAGYQVSEDSSFTGMTTWEPWTSTPQTDSFTLSGGDGPKTVYVRVKDANDHINGATTLDRDSITLDAAGPTFSSQVAINGGVATTVSTGVTLSINATDAGSSVAGYQVSEDSSFTGMTTWESWTSTPQTASFTLSGGDGLKTVYVRVRDVNGNINGATTLDRDSIMLDAVGPTFSSVTINGGATSTTGTGVTLSINATDAGSSVAGYQVSEDSSFTGMTTWESWTSTPQTASFTLSGGDGVKTVYVRVRDANGHINGATTLDRDTISLDQLAPVFSSQVVINSGATATNNPAVTLSINATDAGSSVAGYQVSEDSSFTGMTTWEPWTSTPQTDSFTLSGGDGPKTVYVRVKDANDHINGATTLDRDSITLDTTAPQIDSVEMGTGNLSAVVTFDEDIFGDAVQGPLATTALTVVPPSGAQVESSSTNKTGVGEATVSIIWKTGKEPLLGETIGIQATSATSVYDSVGNAMAAGAGGSGTAKRLSFSTPAGGSIGTVVRSVLSSFGGGGISFPSSGQGGAVAVASAPAAPSAPLPARAVASSTQPLTQFHRRITRDTSVGEITAVAAAPAETAASRAAAETGAAKAAPVGLRTGPTTTAGQIQTTMSDMATMASLEMQPAEERQAPSPWLVVGLALGAALLLAGGLFTARLLARPGFRR